VHGRCVACTLYFPMYAGISRKASPVYNMFDSEHNRRDFLSLMASMLSSPFMLPARKSGSRLSSTTLRVAVVSSGSPSPREESLLRGIWLGLAESRQTAGMFAFDVQATMFRMSDLERVTDAASDPDHSGIAAYLGAAEVGHCSRIAEVAASREALYLNAGCGDDALRGPECSSTMFHVAASDTMLRDAAMHSRGKLSGVERNVVVVTRDSDAGDSTQSQFTRLQPTEWHHTLERFGAAQLADRFRARYPEHTIDGPAWSGWLALKIVTEAMLRTRKADPASLRSFLQRDTTHFDGHKGVPLSFRKWDRQLRQPLYVVHTPPVGAGHAATETIDEVPADRRPGEDAAVFLDRLGTSRSDSPCRA
jgi:hypothetical protein